MRIRVTVWLAIVVVLMGISCAAGYWMAGFMAVDRCLDRGGRWDYARGECVYVAPDIDGSGSLRGG